jgi:hypothetical protein
MVYSEQFGWNADMRELNGFNYIYYTVAAQLAHQWWGQQVSCNQTVGARVVIDGPSTYAAIMLMGKKYGREGLIDALQMENRDYTWGRRENFNPEHDLLHANRGYLGNDKAGIVLYGLQGLISEDSLNAALREFGHEFAFQNGGLYAGSRDLYRVLQKHVPDSFRYYLQDTWENVCLYNNKVLEASAKPLGKDSLYTISLTIDIRKLYFDSSGNEYPAARTNDYIDIGVFSNPGGASPEKLPTNMLYLKRWRLTAGKHHFEFTVRGKPSGVGIDPDRKLLDRNMDDNLKTF